MDRLTQTQNATDELIQLMYASLTYLTTHRGFKPVSDHFAISQSPKSFDDPETFQKNKTELVSDFVRHAKQLDFLISVLPKNEDSNAEDLAQLQTELDAANADYLDALERAKALREAIQPPKRL